MDPVVNIDHATHQVAPTLLLPDAPEHDDEVRADPSIRYFDHNNAGSLALHKAFQEAQKLRSLVGVYTSLDYTNTYDIANQKATLRLMVMPTRQIQIHRSF